MAKEPAPVQPSSHDNDVEELHQGELDSLTLPVPVKLVSPARVDQLPLRVGAARSTDISSTEPEKIVGENSKRSSITFAALGTSFRIATSREAAMRDDSSFLIFVNVGVMKFHFLDEVWAMKTAVGATTDRLVVMTEDWTR